MNTSESLFVVMVEGECEGVVSSESFARVDIGNRAPNLCENSFALTIPVPINDPMEGMARYYTNEGNVLSISISPLPFRAAHKMGGHERRRMSRCHQRKCL